jgi:hypothetical protein
MILSNYLYSFGVITAFPPPLPPRVEIKTAYQAAGSYLLLNPRPGDKTFSYEVLPVLWNLKPEFVQVIPPFRVLPVNCMLS